MLQNISKYNVILASNSPRRKELLAGLNIPFSVKVICDIDETVPKFIVTEDSAEYLAKKKSEAYKLQDDELLITADTIVILEDDEILGKPKNKEHAKTMIRKLSKQKHKVVTGVCLRTNVFKKSFSCMSEVEFGILEEQEIDFYINKYRPFDKAGAYGVQEWIGYIGIKKIIGSYYNIMGLPVYELYHELKKI